MKLKLLILLFSATLFATALTADAVLNIDQPVRTLKLSSDQMKNAIINAALEQQWRVTQESEGRLSATYRKSDYMAKIAITYAPTFYTINYADSTRMRYDGTSIHPTYNKLIKALQANIIRNLKTGDFETDSDDTGVVDSGTDTEQEDIRTKLVKIKELYEAGLITEAEYDTKRKALIEAY